MSKKVSFALASSATADTPASKPAPLVVPNAQEVVGRSARRRRGRAKKFEASEQKPEKAVESAPKQYPEVPPPQSAPPMVQPGSAATHASKTPSGKRGREKVPATAGGAGEPDEGPAPLWLVRNRAGRTVVVKSRERPGVSWHLEWTQPGPRRLDVASAELTPRTPTGSSLRGLMVGPETRVYVETWRAQSTPGATDPLRNPRDTDGQNNQLTVPQQLQIRVPLIPPSIEDRWLQEAFPCPVEYGTVPSSTYHAAQCAAVAFIKQSIKFDAFFATCPALAHGKHWIGVPRREIETTWCRQATEMAPTVVDEVSRRIGPSSQCNRGPIACDCVDREPKSRTLMVGLSEVVTPKVVLECLARWKRVFAVVPNPRYALWNTSNEDGKRVFQVKGEEPIVLPNHVWFGNHTSLNVWTGWFKRTTLAWTKTQIGKAFLLVEFQRPPHRRHEYFASVACLWDPYELNAGAPASFGGVNVRSEMVEKAAGYLTGKALTQDAYNQLERTTSRLIAEEPSELPSNEETIATALAAWYVTRKRRMHWAPLSWWSDLTTWGHTAFVKGNTTKIMTGLAIAATAASLYWNVRKLSSGDVWNKVKAAVGSVAKQGVLAAESQRQRLPLFRAAEGIVHSELYPKAASSVTHWVDALHEPTPDPVTDIGFAYERGFKYGERLAEKYERGHVPAAWVLMVLTAPFYEEAIKSVGGFWATTAIVAFELPVVAAKLDPVGVVKHVVQHYAWWRCGYKLGTLAHFLHNLSVVVGTIDGLPATVDWSGWGYMMFWLLDPALAGHKCVTGVCSLEAQEGMFVEETQSLFDVVPPVGGLPDCGLTPDVELIGPGLRVAVPLVYRSCAHNEVVALRKRLGQDLLWFDHRVTSNWTELHCALRQQYVAQYWEPLRLLVGVGGVIPTDFEEWLRGYPEGQKAVFRQAREDCRRSGVVGRERRVKAFIKVERLPILVEKIETKSAKPRLIQGRDPAVTATSGPTFHAFGKLLRTVWSREADLKVFYASGVTAEEVGMWYGDQLAKGLEPWPVDGEVWDASMGPGPHMSLRLDLEELGVNHATRKVLRERGEGRECKTRFGIRYRLIDQVCSGDGDTSAGNSAAHGKMWIGLLHDAPEARVAINGDNALAMLASRDLEYYEDLLSRFTKYGFKFTPETSSHTQYDAEFCSGRLWKVGPNRFVYGPKIGRVMAKTFWAIDAPKRPGKRLGWLRGVALGLRRDVAFVPILRTVVEMLVYETSSYRGATPPDPDEPWKIHALESHSASDETFAQMEWLYGLTRKEILDCEEWLKRHTTLQAVLLSHPVIDQITRVDLQ